MSALETSAGRQMCSLTHPSTVKNFPHPHSPLSNFSLTHTHPAQSFPSPALIPHQPIYFPAISCKFFIITFVDQFMLDYYTLYQTLLLFIKLKVMSSWQAVTFCVGLYVSSVSVSQYFTIVMQLLFTVHHFYCKFPSTIIPSTAVSSLFISLPVGIPHTVPSPAGFPAGYCRNTAWKFPRRSLVHIDKDEYTTCPSRLYGMSQMGVHRSASDRCACVKVQLSCCCCRV